MLIDTPWPPTPSIQPRAGKEGPSHDGHINTQLLYQHTSRMPRGRNSNKPPFVILADPNDPTSEVIAQYCGGCKTHRPVAAFYTSRIVWRRGFCKSCDLNHQNGRNRANPLRARVLMIGTDMISRHDWH